MGAGCLAKGKGPINAKAPVGVDGYSSRTYSSQFQANQQHVAPVMAVPPPAQPQMLMANSRRVQQSPPSSNIIRTETHQFRPISITQTPGCCITPGGPPPAPPQMTPMRNFLSPNPPLYGHDGPVYGPSSMQAGSFKSYDGLISSNLVPRAISNTGSMSNQSAKTVTSSGHSGPSQVGAGMFDSQMSPSFKGTPQFTSVVDHQYMEVLRTIKQANVQDQCFSTNQFKPHCMDAKHRIDVV